jgi:hypothetical protein
MRSISITCKLHVPSTVLWLVLAQMELRGCKISRSENVKDPDLGRANSDSMSVTEWKRQSHPSAGPDGIHE